MIAKKKIKKYYNIDLNESLLIFKIDKFNEYSLIPIVEYEIYNIKSKKILNISICNNTKIHILYPENIDEKKLYLYNPSSDYYKDICYIDTSEYGTDITLNDRKNEYINQNRSICEVNCDLEGYNKTIKKSICECEIKIKLPLISEIKIDREKLFSNFEDIKNIANFKMMKCIPLLFNKNNLFINSSNYLMIALFILSIISLFWFVFKNKIEIKKIINLFFIYFS